LTSDEKTELKKEALRDGSSQASSFKTPALKNYPGSSPLKLKEPKPSSRLQGSYIKDLSRLMIFKLKAYYSQTPGMQRGIFFIVERHNFFALLREMYRLRVCRALTTLKMYYIKELRLIKAGEIGSFQP